MAGLSRGFPNEIQVNSTTLNNQVLPVGVSFLDDQSMFFYESNAAAPTIVANLFGSNFVREGSLITLSTGLIEEKPASAVLANVSGQTPNRAIVVWDEQTATTSAILERIVDENGNTSPATPIALFAGAAGQFTDADIAAFSGSTGRSVVTATDNIATGSLILAKILQANGTTPLGATVTVTPNPAFLAQHSAVATLNDGNFVVVWQDTDPTGANPDTSGFGIHAKIFDVSGAQQGNEITVNVITTGNQSLPKVAALSSGDFAVTWVDPSLHDDPHGFAIKARVFHADGTAVTDELTVNDSSFLGNQTNPSIAAGPNGSFVVAWTDPGGNIDTSGTGIVAQAFSGTGDKLGSPLLVNQIPTGSQTHVDLSSRPDGSILATFEDASGQVQGGQTPDTSGLGIQAEVLTVDTHTITRVERFFDTATNDHFYTSNPAEIANVRATLPTFHDEGSPWGTPDKGTDTVDVFRFFDTATGDHFYTSSTAERDNIIAHNPTYHFEGVALEAYTAPEPGTLTLERFFNTIFGVHHYSASAAETAAINAGSVGPGWVEEGPGFIVHT
jgi:Repeat of unknown function (DUF5648)